VQKTSPSLIFYNLVQGLLAQASLARPSELTCQIFIFFCRGNITMAPPYRLAFSYSNLLKLESGIDYLFKTNNSNNYYEFKGY